jgi:virginiamycin B lyase
MTLQIREWEVPYPQSRPRDPFVAGTGTVWFGTDRNTIGYAKVHD